MEGRKLEDGILTTNSWKVLSESSIWWFYPILHFIESADDQQERERRVMELLAADNKYDEHQAMILTQMYDFKPGILYLFGRTKQYQQIVRYYMEKKAYSGNYLLFLQLKHVVESFHKPICFNIYFIPLIAHTYLCSITCFRRYQCVSIIRFRRF